MDTVFLWPDGPMIYDDPSVFPVGTDAVALSRFTGSSRGKGIDLGCGSGAIGLALAYRNPRLDMTLIDIQSSAAQAAQRNIELNNLSFRMRAECADLREYAAGANTGIYDLCVCNPPYYPVNGGMISGNSAKAVARTELYCTLEDVCRCASRLLKTGGRFCMVHKPERLTEIIYTLHGMRLEAKRIQFLKTAPDSSPSLVLIESRLGGGPGTVVERDIYPENLFK